MSEIKEIRKTVSLFPKRSRILALCIIAVALLGFCFFKYGKRSVGSGSVVVGAVSGDVGDHSVVVGATDAYGNTILIKPMAIGNNACNGSGGIAIGNNAKADCPSPPAVPKE